MRELSFVRRGAKLAVLCLDLDHFKSINDTLGHQAGDALLKEVAQRIRRCLNEGDLIARLGGDEFAVVRTGLQHPKEAVAFAIAGNRCRSHLRFEGPSDRKRLERRHRLGSRGRP